MTRKTIVITGCSSGFGRFTALDLAGRGWHVFATVRKDADRASLLAEATARHCEEHLTVLLCDITQQEQVQALAREVESLLRSEAESVGQSSAIPSLHALLNNAGTAYGGPLEILPLDDLRAQFELNVIAHVSVTQAFLPLLKAARGTIINVSSLGGRISVPVTGAYSASKFALEAISDALRIELAPFGVRVVIIEPASSPTSIWITSLQRSLDQLGQYKENGSYVPLMKFAEKYALSSSKKGFPAQLFVDTVVKALSAKNPRIRYGIPRSTPFIIFMRKFIPDRWFDAFVRRAIRW